MSTDRPTVLTRLRPLVVLLVPALLAGAAPDLAAQNAIGDQIKDSQDRLDQIRREKQQLAREYDDLRGQVHTFSEEISNIEQRIGSSRGAMDELDLQIQAYALQVDETTRDMLRTHDELVLRRTELEARLREIYKRGDLHAVQVMMEARSFGDLLSRYKYLHLVARYDRTLVSQVQRLEERLVEQRQHRAHVHQVSEVEARSGGAIHLTRVNQRGPLPVTQARGRHVQNSRGVGEAIGTHPGEAYTSRRLCEVDSHTEAIVVLVPAPDFKSGGGCGDTSPAGSIPVRFRHLYGP